ncbi:MAG: hypothetical protein M3A44_00735 [Gammaproteobacteria bacterium]
MKPSALLIMGVLCLFTGVSEAEDTIESSGTKIIGDSDMPKTLYIVPWKKPETAPLPARSMGEFANAALAPLDRDTLLRQMQYHAIFNSR